MQPPLGKVRRLQQCATDDGKFVILAVDHRDNLQGYLENALQINVSHRDMAEFKVSVTAALKDHYSAVLLDPIYGAPTAVAAGAVPGGKGLLLCVEKSGYIGKDTARETAILPGWSVEKIARMGGCGVKMLLYYNPDAPNAGEQETVVREVAEQCARCEVPFFLEPIAYSLDPLTGVLPSDEKRRIVVHAAKHLTPLGVDILKAEFPINIADEPDENVWREACEALTDASAVPWVLLSAGVGFDDFSRQTQVACRAGASGVMVGRAVWKEAIGLVGSARSEFLSRVAVARMQTLAEICDQYARPWYSSVPDLSTKVTEGWYLDY